MFRLGVVVGYSGSVVKTFANAIRELKDEGYEIELRAAYQKAPIDWHSFTHWLAAANAAFLYISPFSENAKTLLRAVEGKVVIALGEGARESTVPSADVARAERYFRLGGEENIKRLILFMGKLSGYDFHPQPPQESPWLGIYHPALGVFTNVAEYKKRYQLEPEVGLLFYRSAWVNGDIATVDTIIRELEGRGIGVRAVFSHGASDKRLGIPGNEEALSLLQGVELLINLQSFSLSLGEGASPLIPLDVPALQLVKEYYKTAAEWRGDPQGIGAMSQITTIAQPEFDGTIEPIIISAKAEASEPEGSYQLQMPIPDRVSFLADRIRAWLKLSQTPKKERRLTFVLHNAPCKSVEATVGRGSGLDTLESMVRILRALEENGYAVNNIPQDGKALIELIMSRKAISEFRWTSSDEIVAKGGVLHFVSVEEYERWFERLPQGAREKVSAEWGPPPGEGMVYQGQLLITGINLGNVNIVVQPKRGCAGARCDGEVCKILHDPDIPPPHHWLATYSWIQENSDAVIHVGTHGYLEFLPGKGIGLSEECFPEISIGDKPHLYIYTVKNPMEGVIAKRRGYATLVDHLVPVLAPSELYDELEELEELLRQYENAAALGEEGRIKLLKDEILQAAERAHLDLDAAEFDASISIIHERLTQLRETQIRDGLHILSQPPEGEGLIDMLVSILRFDGGKPSLRRAILEVQGFDYDEVLGNPAQRCNGRTYGELLDESTQIALQLVRYALSDRDVGTRINELMEVRAPQKLPQLVDVLEYGLSLVPKIRETEREIPQLLKGLEKRFIEPGASGNISRGRVEVLPTGRNFYTIDPSKIPTRAACRIGEKLAEELLDKFLKEEERYPESMGMVLFSTDAFRSDGEEIGQILHLIGTKPKWDGEGKVRGIETIPLEKLGRPRIDCTVRLSGIFRDTLPNLTGLLDEAFRQVMALNEPPELNFLRKHTLELEPKVGERAKYRIFSAPPGAYGAGVNLAIEASAWENEEDLRDVYINWGGYAYGRDVHGEKVHDSFALNLKGVEVSFNKLETDEADALDCCCFFGYHGGLTIAAKSLSGREVKTYWGDTRDPNHPHVRDMKDEMERIVRTRLLNPKWLEGKKRHGYKGAGDISSRVLHVYGWDATAGVVEDWIYDEILSRIVSDMRDWFMENNPYALEEICRRLLEANERGLWAASKEDLEQLRQIYLDLEGLLEDEERKGEFQGGEIVVKTKRDVAEWEENVRGIERAWKEIL